MWRLIFLSIIQSILLVSGQVFLKFAMAKMGKFCFSWSYFRELLVNWNLLFSGLSMAGATVLWLIILKRYEFSMAYPMISISYIIGLVVAVSVFHEVVPMVRWIGVALIMLGVVLVVQK